MKPRDLLIRLAVVLLFASTPAMAAENSVLSGHFDGSEPEAAHFPGGCEDDELLGYRQIGPIQVSADGPYTVIDPFQEYRADIVAAIYQGSYDPANPQAGLLTPTGIDESGTVRLDAGIDYVVLVQPWCEWYEGAWALSFTGPGSVMSDNRVEVPEFTMGQFTNEDPLVELKCGNTQYVESGPIRLSRSGTYYYSDMSKFFDVDTCLQIYSAPFDAGNPDANLVSFLDDFGQVELEAGRDYYFVSQPYFNEQAGDFFYILAPPAQFLINYLMSGAWADFATLGQGFLLDVFDKRNEMFVAWFTFDLNRPDESASAQLGEPGHRWLTVQGPFSGNKAPLIAYLTEGGVFDFPQPPPITDLDGYGTVDLEFSDCKTGTVTYDLASDPPQMGVIPIKRLIEDTVPLCEEWTTGPGVPGSIAVAR